MHSTLEAALYLAGKGFRVFPLRANGNKPLAERFQFTATSDPERIRSWWSQPDTYGCNVGVLTNDMVVADLDMKNGKNGVKSYAELGDGTYETFVVSTASGGYHCYFEGPDSRLQVNVFDGIDIRSHNGYVVGPGSVIDGRAYEIVSDKPLQWVPLSIAAVLKPARSAVSQGDGIAALDTPEAVANAAEWLRQAPPAIEGQGGDDHTYKIAAKLVRDFALTIEAAQGLMSGEWNERCSPPWEPADLWLKLTNAVEYAAGEIGSAQPVVHFNAVTALAVPPAPPQPTPAERGIRLGNLMLATEIRARPWKIKGLVMTGDVTVLAGVGAAGKSMLELTIAAHAALGKDYGPWKLAAPGIPMRSVIYNSEDDMEEQARRLYAICAHYGFIYNDVKANLAIIDDSQGDLILARTTPDGRVATQHEAGVEFLVQTLADCKADLAFIDPMLNTHELNENDNQHMRFFVTLLRNISRVTGVGMIAAQHSTKGAGTKEKGDVDAIRGAGNIVNSARKAILLSNVTSEDRSDYGLGDRKHYIRVDDAKTNYSAKMTRAMAYMEWESVHCPWGDSVGVPFIVDVVSNEGQQQRMLGGILYDGMIAQGVATVTKAAAGKIIAEKDGLWNKQSATQRQRNIEKLLDGPLRIAKGTISIVNGEVHIS